MTFSFTIDDDLMQEMHHQSGIYNRSELCSEMVSIYKWLMDEVCAGKLVVTLDKSGEDKTICDATTFQNIERRNLNFGHERNRI